MKIYPITVRSFAIVDTEIGCFRVWENGDMELWDNITSAYCWFDITKYHGQVIEDVRMAGLEAINLPPMQKAVAPSTSSWQGEVDRQGGSFTAEEMDPNRGWK